MHAKKLPKLDRWYTPKTIQYALWIQFNLVSKKWRSHAGVSILNSKRAIRFQFCVQHEALGKYVYIDCLWNTLKHARIQFVCVICCHSKLMWFRTQDWHLSSMRTKHTPTAWIYMFKHIPTPWLLQCHQKNLSLFPLSFSPALKKKVTPSRNCHERLCMATRELEFTDKDMNQSGVCLWLPPERSHWITKRTLLKHVPRAWILQYHQTNLSLAVPRDIISLKPGAWEMYTFVKILNDMQVVRMHLWQHSVCGYYYERALVVALHFLYIF